MEYLSFIIYTLIFISILTPVAIVIFEFFDVQFETYGNYLLWFMALALFNALLPVRPKDIFYNISKPLKALINNAKSIGNDIIQPVEKPIEKPADNLSPTSVPLLETNIPILSNRTSFGNSTIPTSPARTSFGNSNKSTTTYPTFNSFINDDNITESKRPRRSTRLSVDTLHKSD